MHKNGWRPFWAALGAALLVLLPLVGGTVLLTRQMVRTRIQTAQPQSGVPIQLPRAEHRMTLLLCTAGEQPGFLLVYLNAAQNSLNLLAVPGELTVPFNGETASLAHCYGAAGPARCRQALLEVLGLPEDMFYLALSPAVLEKTASRYGPVRVGFSGALTADELAETGLSAAVQSISAKEAHALLSGWDADGTLPPARRAAARAAVWEAFFRQGGGQQRGPAHRLCSTGLHPAGHGPGVSGQQQRPPPRRGPARGVGCKGGHLHGHRRFPGGGADLPQRFARLGE